LTGDTDAGRGGIVAVVLAGGRLSGAFARAAGTRWKAMAPVGDQPLVVRVVRALDAVPSVTGVYVPGPEGLSALLPAGAVWVPDAGSAIGNLLAALAAAGRGAGGVLVSGADLPAVTPEAVSAFLSAVPAGADVCLPLVEKAAFTRAFPGSPGIYVRLADGAFTAGGLLWARAEVLEQHEAICRALFGRRKSQLAMAALLGPRLVGRLLLGRLTVAEVEARVSALTGCACRAARGCAPELAYDVDTLFDLIDARRRFRRSLA
jgi:molybdopterin-guanine dinucleotide biosynthesis protein A